MTAYVERELLRVSSALRDPAFAAHYDEFYAAQQALSWVLDPTMSKAPFDQITKQPSVQMAGWGQPASDTA